MDFRAADAAYTQALDAVDNAQDELSQAEYEYQQASNSGNTAALSAIQSRIDAAQSKLSSANAAADVAEANYTAAKAENDRTQQSQQAKATPTAADKVKEDVPTAQNAEQDGITEEEQQNIENDKGEDTADPGYIPPEVVTTENSQIGAETADPGYIPPDQEVPAEPFVVVINGYPKIPTVRPNPLHDYSSYTYLLTLHLLDKSTFNILAESRKYGSEAVIFKTDNVLMASAGRFPEGKGRNPAWKENFYIENLDLSTVIGLSAASQGSNAIGIKFNIIEPLGLTLIERLLKSSEATSYANYLEMAYAMQIDFIGYDDDGNIKSLPDHTKYIPIKFTGITFKVTERGTEYAVSAVPYNHTAFNTSHVNAPVSMSITASTVDDYFMDFGQVLPTELKVAAVGANAEGNAGEAEANQNTKKPTAIKAASWAVALNSNEKRKQKEIKGYIPDRYQIIFEEEIGKSRLTSVMDKKKAEITNTPMKGWVGYGDSAGGEFDTTSKYLKPNDIDYSAVTYTVNSGTSLVSEINRIVRNSEFLISQLTFTDPLKLKELNDDELKKEAEKNNKKLKWWRIIPSVKLLDFDYSRNTYAKEITYFVIVYEVATNQMKDTPKTLPYPVKIYDYLFTGKNKDVITFNLDFNTTFYVAVTTGLAKQTITSTSATTSAINARQQQEERYGRNNLANTRYNFQSGNNQATAGAGNKRDAMSQVTADIQTHLFGRPSGDLVTLDMTIIGDPDFIKQDDLFSGAVSNAVALNNSLPMDTGEVYIRVNFNTPTDYDDESGLTRGETKSKFSGIYRLLSIDNQFQSGKFTQKLNAVRIFHDGVDDVDTGKEAEIAEVKSPVTLSQQENLKDSGAGDEAAAQAAIAANTATPAGNIPDEDSTTSMAENEALAEVAENSPEKSINESSNNISEPSVVNTPTNTFMPKAVATTPADTTQIDDGVYQFKDPLGKSQVVPVNTQEGVDAIASATKTGEFAIYVDKDPNLGWVKVAYNPATGTRSIQEEYGDTPPQSKK